MPAKAFINRDIMIEVHTSAQKLLLLIKIHNDKIFSPLSDIEMPLQINKILYQSTTLFHVH